MKPRFKRDDVVRYMFEDRLCEGIIDECVGNDVYGRALRVVHDPQEPDREHRWELYDNTNGGPLADEAAATMHLHPDPDPVWASYCAALISGDFDE